MKSLHKPRFLVILIILLPIIPILLISNKYFSPSDVYGQIGFDCSNINMNTVDGNSIFSQNSQVLLSLTGAPENFDAELFLKIISGLQSEAVYTLPIDPPVNGISRNSRVDVLEMLRNIPPVDSDQFFILYTKVYDDNGELRCNGDPTVGPDDPAFCPKCTKLLTITSNQNLLNYTNNTQETLGIVNAQVDTTPTPTASPTPTPFAYFRFTDNLNPQNPDKFTFLTTDGRIIQMARDIIAGVITDTIHVAGIIRKYRAEPEDYNKPWNYHLYEGNIVFFSTPNESCDAGIREIHDRLEAFIQDPINNPGVCTSEFLPNCLWCPSQSTLIEEVEDPFTNQCTYAYNGDANGDGKATGNDFSAWAFYFDPFNQIEGNESVGDFNCDGFVNGNDFSIWSFNFTPF